MDDDTQRDLDEWLKFSPEEWDGPERSKLRRWAPGWVDWVAMAVVAAALVGMVVLWPSGSVRQGAALRTLGIPSQFHAAEVVSVVEEPCAGVPDVVCAEVEFRIDEGPDAGEIYHQSFPPSALTPEFDVGSTAILSRLLPNGRVIAVGEAPCAFDPAATCRVLTVEVVVAEEAVTADYVTIAEEPAALMREGEDAIVQVAGTGEDSEIVGVTPPDVQTAYQFSGEFQRRPVLLFTAILFAVMVIVVGLWRGVGALGGMAASLAVILLFVVPSLVEGNSPILVAMVGATAIAAVTLYISHGFTRISHVAILGITGALLLTAALAWAGTELARFSGFTSEESGLLTLFEGIDVAGLLLAGIVLGTAGALDDVAVTQAASVWELAAADPGSERRTWFSRAMRIGRSHIASTVNTLLLAYAGAALPLLILFVLAEQSLGAIANSEIVAVEIIRTLIGSIGLVAAVPLTTWLAAQTVARPAAAD
jgi:uncharacterized membrane protein